MTLLITIFAAVFCTVIWYTKAREDNMQLSTLCFTYWGASLMWMVDAIFEFVEIGEKFFNQAATDMLNDAFLGFSCVALGMLIWLVSVLVRDSRGIIYGIFQKSNK